MFCYDCMRLYTVFYTAMLVVQNLLAIRVHVCDAFCSRLPYFVPVLRIHDFPNMIFQYDQAPLHHSSTCTSDRIKNDL
jgi:hypothetical protein